MSHRLVRVREGVYVDSVQLMSATRTAREQSGVEWAGLGMGTPVNQDTLREQGFEDAEFEGAGPNDLMVAVVAASADEAEDAADAAEASLRDEGERESESPAEERPRTVEAAARSLEDANVAVVSVPGEYAALEAHKALTAGLHVLLFSDHVAVADEVALKARAEEAGLLLMGPGAGTAMLGGVGLGFANAVGRGSVGVVAAAGTGAQEVMTLLDRWGPGVSHVIGVGGRDLTDEVGGRMTRQGLRALRDDPSTEALLLVSKPPDPDVASAILPELEGEPAVTCLLGGIGDEDGGAAARGVPAAGTLEGAAREVVELLGHPPPEPWRGLREVAESAGAGLAEERTLVKGLFSGGSLCSEAMALIASRLGPVHSNVPLRDEWSLPAPKGAHVCLDMGEEEYTQDRPHPMIDAELRADAIVEAGDEPTTAVVLLDVVLGYGSHDDPASVLAPVCERVTSRPDGPAVVVYVLGTDEDSQDRAKQVSQFEDAGCVVAPTSARSALLAAAIAARQPDIAQEPE